MSSMVAMPVSESARPLHTDGTGGVLFLHGFTGSPRSMRPWAERTASEGYRVSLPRLPGHGTTLRELARTSWQDWYAVAERELLALRRASGEPVFVAALSMGGALALRLAERQPDAVAALILVNPAMSASNRLLPLAGAMKHVIASQASIANDIAKPGVLEGAYDRTPVAAAHELTRLWADIRPYLDLVTCPIMLMTSSVDHVVPASSAELIRRQVSSLDIAEVTLARSYHVATLDHDADLIADRSLAFIASHRPDAAPRP